MTVRLANAPVSYGVFELTLDSDRFLAPAERVLDEVRSAGYAGIDLGSVGYLGDAAGLGERLADRGLGLAGAYIELRFEDRIALDAGRPYLESALDMFDAAIRADAGQHPAPRPTLAAASSPSHQRRPGGAQHDRSIGLDDSEWARFVDGLQSVAARCRERGYEPAFHHHAGTAIEAPWEIERLLDTSDVGLCLDTGHLTVGGGDPVADLLRWGPRIRQLHLKDARRADLDQIAADGGSATEIWTRGVFCPLGSGDLNVAGVVDAIVTIGYDGWIVVEEDVLIADEAGFERAAVHQRANRVLLQRLGL
ncbi:MAG TPA: sugar phosphate isomerase/epimerase [Candidatus Limnocylindrales bacterium]|nr:sugar phosphate isomerase/epimerase [Candidatus Limnocylindrales bacterium]